MQVYVQQTVQESQSGQLMEVQSYMRMEPVLDGRSHQGDRPNPGKTRDPPAPPRVARCGAMRACGFGHVWTGGSACCPALAGPAALGMPPGPASTGEAWAEAGSLPLDGPTEAR